MSSAISFSTTSASYVLVTNASVTITTTGRPVLLFILGTLSLGGTSNLDSLFGYSVDSGSTFLFEQELSISGASIVIGGGAILFMDTPAAGTYTYKLYAKKAATGTTVSVLGKLVAWEL